MFKSQKCARGRVCCTRGYLFCLNLLLFLFAPFTFSSLMFFSPPSLLFFFEIVSDRFCAQQPGMSIDAPDTPSHTGLVWTIVCVKMWDEYEDGDDDDSGESNGASLQPYFLSSSFWRERERERAKERESEMTQRGQVVGLRVSKHPYLYPENVWQVKWSCSLTVSAYLQIS